MESIDRQVLPGPSYVQGTVVHPQPPNDLQTTTSPFDPTSNLMSMMVEVLPKGPVSRGQPLKHKQLHLKLFHRDAEGNKKEVINTDPAVSFRLYFGLYFKAFELLLTDPSISFKDVYVYFTSLEMKSSDLEHPKYFTTERHDMELSFFNCCNVHMKDIGLRSFEFLVPAHSLPHIVLRIHQCDQVTLRTFDAPTFDLVTCLILSEDFIYLNEPWTKLMLSHFQQNSPGKLRELSLPLPIYFVTDIVTGITGFLRGKGSEVRVIFTEIGFKVGSNPFSPSHGAAVRELRVVAEEAKVTLEPVGSSGGLDELLREDWTPQASALFTSD